MTLAQLEYVVAVDTHRHFGRAAEHCHITQPSLSTQVLKLERQLGVEIFDRSRQPVQPTDLGRKLIEQARVILREAARIDELISESRGEVAGDLRIGVLPTLAPYLLPRFLEPLLLNHPRITLNLEELRTEEILDRVANDRLDVGLIASAVERPDLTEDLLFEEPFFGYVSEAEPYFGLRELGVGDLRLDELWLLNEGHCFRDQVVELCGEAQKPVRGMRPVHFESGNLETLRRMVETSGGMTLLPALATLGLSEAERRRIRPFRDPPPTRVVRMVRGRGYLKRQAVAALKEEICRSVEGEPGGVRVVAEA